MGKIICFQHLKPEFSLQIIDSRLTADITKFVRTFAFDSQFVCIVDGSEATLKWKTLGRSWVNIFGKLSHDHRDVRAK